MIPASNIKLFPASTLIRFDAGLSEAGVKEAEAGGKALKDAGYTFDVAHTSLLTRYQGGLWQKNIGGAGPVAITQPNHK